MSLISNHLEYFNAAVCVALAIHGICTINHFTKETPCLMRVGVAIFTVGCVGVALGPVYGFDTVEPAETFLTFGLLVYAMRKELLSYAERKKR